MLALTETWLTGDFFDTELFPLSFNVFRSDRKVGCTRGGGCLLWIKSLIFAVRIPDLECSNALIDAVWVKVKCSDNSTLFICVVYIQMHLTSFKEFMYSLKNACNNFGLNSTTIVLGDFNCPKIRWSDNLSSRGLSPSSVSGQPASTLLEYCEVLLLAQYNSVLNNTGNILDLVLWDSEIGNIRVRQANYELVRRDVYHPPLSI